MSIFVPLPQSPERVVIYWCYMRRIIFVRKKAEYL